jgi:hypothetical protein
MMPARCALAWVCALALPRLPSTADDGLRLPADVPWQVRRTQPSDVILPGATPAWTVEFLNTRALEVEISDRAAGDCRGHVLIGKPLTLPATLPYRLALRLKHQTYCARPDRSGEVAFYVFTPRLWNTLQDDSLTRQQFNPSAPPEGTLAGGVIHSPGDPVGDVTSWQVWESPNLSRRLRDHAGREVVFAVLWGCYHYGIAEWGKLADIQIVTQSRDEVLGELRAALYSPALFSHFALQQKGLEKVNAAYASGDYETAADELVTYFRRRQTPKWHLRREDRPYPTGGTDRAAEVVCRHEFNILQVPYTFRAGIDWQFSPNGDEQWTQFLNRHYHLQTLGNAYWTTGNERYAREFAAELMDWRLGCPPSGGGPAWHPIAAAIRVSQWVPCFYDFQDSDSLETLDRLSMLQSLWEHGQFLLTHKAANNNIILLQADALLTLASIFPEFQDSANWRDTGNQWLLDVLKNQFYPDGTSVELSAGYEMVSLAALDDIRTTAAVNNVPLPAELLPVMGKCTEALMLLMKPDGNGPSTNDNSGNGIIAWVRKGGELFKRPDMQWLAAAEKTGPPPAAPSVLFPYAGWVVMRTGWGRDDRYLFLDAGPYGQAHQHEDKLAIDLYAFGRTLIADPGIDTYIRNQWSDYFRGTASHSTVTVDGEGQRRRELPDEWMTTRPLRDVRFETSPYLDYAEGTYTGGYGAGGRVRAQHTRKVVFVRPDYWLLFDLVGGEGEHLVSASFQLTPTRAVVDLPTLSARTENPEGNLLIRPVRPQGLGISVASGQEAPVRGWVCPVHYGKREPAPMVTYARLGELPMALATLLYPYQCDVPNATLRPLSVESETGPVPDAEAQGIAVQAGDRTDVVLISHGPPALRRYGPFEFDGELALLTREAGTGWHIRFARGGTILQAPEDQTEAGPG